MQRKVRAYTTLLLGTAAAVSPLIQTGAAQAAANPGQAINNDYGQSAADVAAETTAQVNAVPAVIAAKAALATAHHTALAKAAAATRAHQAYVAAVHSHKAARIRAAKKAVTAATAAHSRAVAAEGAARAALARTIATATTAVKALHYLPVDGSYNGNLFQYFIPGPGLEPIQVSITVSGGHVTAVTVPQHVTTGDSGQYNAMALPRLIASALAAHDTASVSNVSGASETSEAFTKSLQSALTQAGFKS